MHPSKIAQVRRLRRSGFNFHEIANMTRFDIDEVREDALGPAHLHYVLVTMLSRVPKWWTGTRQAYYHCVRSNFADVA
jgi:hypothetical protein